MQVKNSEHGILQQLPVVSGHIVRLLFLNFVGFFEPV